MCLCVCVCVREREREIQCRGALAPSLNTLVPFFSWLPLSISIHVRLFFVLALVLRPLALSSTAYEDLPSD